MTALTAGRRVLLVYGSGSVKKNGCYDDVKKAVENGGGVLYEHSNASRELSDIEKGMHLVKENRIDLTTLFPRFLRVMAKYHDADIRRYFKNAFGYEGNIEESANKVTELFMNLGIDMYFDGEASPEKIKEIDIITVLSLDEVTDMMKGCLR